MKRRRMTMAVAFIALACLTLAGCSKQYIDASLMGLRYAGGVGEGGKFKDCLETGQAEYSDDTVYFYPTTQRQDDFNTDRYAPDDPNAADNKDIEVTTKDGVTVYIRGNQNFGLATDCDTIRSFHETIGKTRGAYFDSDGSYGRGWITTMNYYITPAVVARWREVISEKNVSELWPATDLYSELTEDVNGDPESTDSMQGAVDARTEGDISYYNRLTFSLTSITPQEDYRTQYLERQKAQTAAETAKLNKDAQIAQAEADQAVRVAQAEAAAAEKREQILAYKLPGMTAKEAVRAYNEAYAIDSGFNPYQPNGMLLGSGTGGQ